MGGEERRDDLAYASYVFELNASGNYQTCEVDMDNYFGTPGDTEGYIQEHIAMLDGSGIPVVCGGLLGRRLETAFPAGAQCYVPALNITRYDGKSCSS